MRAGRRTCAPFAAPSAGAPPFPFPSFAPLSPASAGFSPFVGFGTGGPSPCLCFFCCSSSFFFAIVVSFPLARAAHRPALLVSLLRPRNRIARFHGDALGRAVIL